MSAEPLPDPVCETWSLATQQGLTVCVPSSMRSMTTYVLLEQERWFEPEMSLLPLLLQPGMHALDIGANHGVYALEMARCTQTGHVWVFEPTGAPRANLQRSVLVNGLAGRITVVDAALAEAPGHTHFLVQDNSELNTRDEHGTAQGRHEAVRLEALDDYLAAHAPGVRIDFIKLDAEGGETRVLDGARRFFETQSPVVLFELQHGAHINTGLLDSWVALGYGLFRWSAELLLLLPFDINTDETAFALNLVAVRPAQQADLTARGLLVTAADLATVLEPEADPQALQTWCAQPAAPGALGALGELGADGLTQAASCGAAAVAYLKALQAVAGAHFQSGLTPAQRVALMVSARVSLMPALEGSLGFGPEAWALIVHTLQALGQQHAAVQLAAQIVAQWPQDDRLVLPIVPPQRADLARSRSTPTGPWLRQMLAEFVATRSAHSSYFSAPAPARWAALLSHPDHSAEVERRYMLAHMVQDRVAPVEPLQRLPAAEHTCNPALWQGLLQATRAMACDGVRAAAPC